MKLLQMENIKSEVKYCLVLINSRLGTVEKNKKNGRHSNKTRIKQKNAENLRVSMNCRKTLTVQNMYYWVTEGKGKSSKMSEKVMAEYIQNLLKIINASVKENMGGR